MPDFTIVMSRHYIPASAGDFEYRLALAQDEHYANHGTVPTLCHVPHSVKEYPPSIGVLRVEVAWGLGAHEIDLGVAKEAEVTQ